MRAAATASCTARFRPTPPTGDMAWAASPMHSTPAGANRGVGALEPQLGNLEVALARDCNRHAAFLGAGQKGLAGLIGGRDPEPPGVETDRELFAGHIGVTANSRGAAVAGHRKICQQTPGAGRGGVVDPGDLFALPQHTGDFVFGEQSEAGLFGGGLSKQVEQVPLRHHRDMAVTPAKPGKVRQQQLFAVGCGEPDVLHPGLGKRIETVEEPEVLQQAQRGGMDSIAAEIPQEVGVLLQHSHLDAGSGQQQPQHQTGGACPGNET